MALGGPRTNVERPARFLRAILSDASDLKPVAVRIGKRERKGKRVGRQFQADRSFNNWPLSEINSSYFAGM